MRIENINKTNRRIGIMTAYSNLMLSMQQASADDRSNS